MVKALVLVSIYCLSCGSNAEQDKRADFANLVSDAFKKKDATAILRLYYFDEVHFIFKDLEEIALRSFLSDCEGENFVLEKVEWTALPKEMQDVKETRINGRKYFYPIPLVGQLRVYFRDTEASGASLAGKVFYVGRDSNGEYRLAVTSVSEDGR
jgi:hypothetical protein